MAKNIVQLHERVKFWMDISRTPRFSEKAIDNAINIAVADIIRDRFIPSNTQARDGNNELKGFQRSNTIREELRPLVKSVTLTGANLDTLKGITSTILSSEIAAELAGDAAKYGYYTMFEIILSNGLVLYPVETTQEKLDFLIKDPYNRPSIAPPVRSYFIENSTGYKFYLGELDTLTISSAKVYYLEIPVDMFYGYEILLGGVASGDSILVQETAVVKNGSNVNTSLKIGDSIPFAWVVNNAGSTVKVVNGFTVMTMPDILFDEIAKVAASHLLMIVSRTSQIQQQQ